MIYNIYIIEINKTIYISVNIKYIYKYIYIILYFNYFSIGYYKNKISIIGSNK